MAVQVDTRDSAALSDTDLDEMASIGGSFDIGTVSKAKEDWVLSTAARIDGTLHGYMFATLERIGGTPCVLIGLISVKRTSKRDQALKGLIGMLSVKRSSKRDQVLKGLMGEAFHRALMAFPDEDVVVGTRMVSADGFEAFKQIGDVIPRPGHRAVGEERAWGRRLAKRFAVDANYDEQSFVVKANGHSGYLDHESSKPEKLSADVVAQFTAVNRKKGGVLIVHGWTMAEDLVKLGKR
ncbi:MAG TPA: hypothetical protein PLV68_17160 [Ilumatobacteraceae bacterium]|nr:hypothetical protein [Ilumatobacteraceae bacterium]